MRNLLSIFALAAMLPSSGSAQPAPADNRPFGKYLVQICTWDLKDPAVACTPADQTDRPPMHTPQSIEFKQVARPGSPASADPTYPLVINDTFFVSAKATSGLPVTINILAGAVVAEIPPAGTAPGIYAYRVVGPGTVVLRADRAGDTYYEPASPVTLVFDVGPNSGPPCGGLFPSSMSPRTIATVDAPAIIGLLGVPVPYVLVAAGPRTILIYTTRNVFPPVQEKRVEKTAGPASTTKKTAPIGIPSDSETQVLSNFQNQIQALLNRNADNLGLPAPTPFSVELKIPHAAALGDLATRLSGLNFSQLTVADVSTDKIRVTAPAQPDCKVWTAFLSDIRELTWQLHPMPWNARLFYLGQNNGANGATPTGASDFATAFGALAGTATPAAASTPAATPTATTTPASTPAASPTPPATAPATAPVPAPSTATISITQPPGSFVDIKSDTTPCVIAGLTMSNSSACAGSGAAATSAAGAAAPTVAAPAPTAAIAALEPDLLLFSTPNPGNDEPIAERKRILAQLDLPRPEMIINGWVLQNSTTNSQAIGAFASVLKELVGNYNDSLERVVLRSWGFVRSRIASGNFFDPAFYHYVSDRYVGSVQSPINGKDPQAAAQQFLDSSRAKLTFPDGTTPADFGICPADQYCLGYNNLFQPLKPRLTDVLLALVAAKNTKTEVDDSITATEGPANLAGPSFCEGQSINQREHCKRIWKDLDLDRDEMNACENLDLRLTLGSAFPPPPLGEPPARVFLRCFKQEAEKLLAGEIPEDPTTSPSGAGLMRAAVANFLFNYKMSQQFPHEFKAYDLSQSADGLNSALSPLVDALNRDITTFQRYVRADVVYQVERLNRDYDGRCCAKRLFGLDKPSFFNEGIVTVRTISGQWTYASTTSQSFLNTSSAPQLTDVLNSLTGAATGAGSAAGAGSGTPPPAPISALFPTAGALGSAKLAAAFLNNYQTTYAQIGRSLALSAIPRSLATASAAEIVVSLNADESATPPLYVSGPQSGQNANISRVANHDTSTRVRIDSLKLFELSSFSAVLQRSRSRIPLIPPFVDLPYIGTIAGIPLPPATEYHQSTALLSAMVVPTAADIAYGLQFEFDQTADGAKETCSLLKSAKDDDRCRLRSLISLGDFGERDSVELYNHTIVHCFATDMRSATSSLNGFTPASANACENLSFDTLPYSAR